MKKFIVDTGKIKYIIEANDAMHAVEIVKKINDKNGTVTEKNLEDAVINDSIKGSLDDLIVQAKTPKGIDLRSISLNLADDLIDKAKRDGYDVVITYYDKYARRTKSAKLSESDVANLKYVLRNDSVMRLFIVDSNSALLDSIYDSVVDDSIHDRLGEGKCAPTGNVSLVSSAEYVSELLKNIQKNTSDPLYEKKLAIAKRKYDQIKAMIEHERQEIDAFDRYWQSHKKEMMANILAAEKALR